MRIMCVLFGHQWCTMQHIELIERVCKPYAGTFGACRIACARCGKDKPA